MHPKIFLHGRQSQQCPQNKIKHNNFHQVSVVRSERWKLEPEWIDRF